MLSNDSGIVEPKWVDDASTIIVPGRDLEFGNFLLGLYVHNKTFELRTEENLLAVRRPRDGH